MPNQQLIDYIKQALEAGQTKEQIKDELTKAGWDEETINKSFKSMEFSSAASEDRPQSTSLIGVGDLLKKAWQIYKNRFKTFIGISLAPYVIIIPLAVIFSFGSAFFSSLLKDKGIAAILVSVIVLLIIVVVAFIGMIWSQVSLLYAVKERDAQIGIKDSFAKGWHRIVSFWWISALIGLIVVAGFALFIIPGIIFMVWFSLGIYVLVGEDLRGMAVLSRSKQLVKGYWGKVFWRIIVISVIGFVISFIFALLSNILKIAIVEGLISWILSIILTPFIFAYMFLLYENLKQLKSGEAFESPKKGTRIGLILLAILGPIVLMGGILGSIVLVSLNTARSKARDARRVYDMTRIQVALEEYYFNNEMYPVALDQLDISFPLGLPIDPKTNLPYEYKLLSDGRDYELCAEFEQEMEGRQDCIGSAVELEF